LLSARRIPLASRSFGHTTTNLVAQALAEPLKPVTAHQVLAEYSDVVFLA